MPKPIALIGHAHTCPVHGGGPVLNLGQFLVRFNGIPHTCPIHGGGPVMNPGQTLVTFKGIPLAIEGGQCGCPGTPPLPDPMVRGSSLVKINGRGIMRVGDKTAHGGKIAMGVPTLKSD